MPVVKNYKNRLTYANWNHWKVNHQDTGSLQQATFSHPFSAMSIQSAAWRIGRDTCLAAELRYRWVVWFSSLEGDLRMQRIGDLDAKSIKIRACVVSFYQKTCGLRMLPIRAGLCKSAKADALCSNWIELTTNGSNFELSMFFCIVWTILIFRNDPGHFQPQCHNEIAGVCPRNKKSRANSWWPRHSNEAVQNWIQCQHTIFGSQRALKSLYSVATCSPSTASIDWKCMWIRQAFGTVHQHFRTAQAQAFWDVLLARHAQFEAQSSHFGTCRTLIELQHRDIVIKHFKHFVGPNTQANTSLDSNRCAVWVTNRQPQTTCPLQKTSKDKSLSLPLPHWRLCKSSLSFGYFWHNSRHEPMNFHGCYAAEELVQGAFYPADKRYMVDITSTWFWTVFFWYNHFTHQISSDTLSSYSEVLTLATSSYSVLTWMVINSATLGNYVLMQSMLWNTRHLCFTLLSVLWDDPLESPSSGLLLWSEAPAGYTLWTWTDESGFYLM